MVVVVVFVGVVEAVHLRSIPAEAGDIQRLEKPNVRYSVRAPWESEEADIAVEGPGAVEEPIWYRCKQEVVFLAEQARPSSSFGRITQHRSGWYQELSRQQSEKHGTAVVVHEIVECLAVLGKPASYQQI